MSGGESERGDLPERFSGPGLVDLQLNGYSGFDFNAPPESWTADALHRVRSALGERGVAAALPTFITDSQKALVARAARYAELVSSDGELAATFPKLHIEGPFIASGDGPRGVHPREHCLVPDEAPDLLARIDAASGGRIGILTLAPELPGAIPLIEKAVGRGIRVAIGHTGTSAAGIDAALNAGASLSTHLGNGTGPILPRFDNPVQHQLAEDRLLAGFIADGIHVPFSVLKSFLRAKGAERAVLVTDAVAAADAGPGLYRLGPNAIEATGEGRVTRKGTAELAGSALTLDRAVINVCVRCGVPFEQAWTMASTRPAALTGLGSLKEVDVAIGADGFRLIR